MKVEVARGCLGFFDKSIPRAYRAWIQHQTAQVKRPLNRQDPGLSSDCFIIREWRVQDDGDDCPALETSTLADTDMAT